MADTHGQQDKPSRKKKPKEVKLSGYSAEEIKAQFFNETAILEKPRQIFRLQYEGNRYYYTFNEENEPRFFISITSLTDKQAPKGAHLIKWMADKGIEAAEAHRDKRAEYGTFMHIACGELLLNKRYELELLPMRLEEYLRSSHLPLQWINEFAPELRKDLLSFAQFLKDYEVEPICIEMALASEEYGCATTIDIVCRMNAAHYDKTPEESRKKIWAIVDMKSGKKGFQETHEVQLFMGKLAFEENFPSSPKIDKMFNWAPSDWWKAPSYKLKDQTKGKGAKKLSHYLALQAIDEDGSEKYITVTGGTIDLTQDLTINYKSAPYSEIVKARRGPVAKPKAKKARISVKKKPETVGEAQPLEQKPKRARKGRINSQIEITHEANGTKEEVKSN